MIPGIVASAPTISTPPDPGGSDPHWENVSALLHLNGENGSTIFTDETGKSWSGAGGVAISTAKSKFNGSSLLLDGSNDLVVTDSSSLDFAFGTGDFTIECFVSVTKINQNYQTIIQPNSTKTAALCARSYSSSTIFFWYENGLRCNSTITTNLEEWHHVAVSRDSGLTRLFVNGSESPSNHPDSVNYSAAGFARIGLPTAGLSAFGGNLAEVRITKGVARYTADFTPPSYPFPTS